MSSFKTNRLIFAIGALIIGIILLIWPGTSLMIIGRCIGAVLAVGGIVAAFLFWKDHESMSRTLLLVMAAVMLICGIVIILHPDELVKLIPTIMGVLAVMSGLINIGETFLLNRQKYGKWWISLIVAALKIAAGLFVIRNAFDLVSIITRVAGGVMVFSGCSDLWVLSRLAFAEKNAAAMAEAGTPPVDSAENAAADAAAGNTPADAENAAPADVAGGAAAAPVSADTANTPAVDVETENTPYVPEDAANTSAAPVEAAPASAETLNAPNAPEEAASAPEDMANEPVAPEEVADPGNVSPSLVWDDGGADADQAEVPEYMRQEEQPGDYKKPEEDA